MAASFADDLQNQIAAKYEEVERLGAKLDATLDDAQRAETLVGEAEALSKKLYDYQEAQERIRSAREAAERRQSEIAKPVRKLPFTTGATTWRPVTDGAKSIDFDAPVSGLSEAPRFCDTVTAQADTEKKSFNLENTLHVRRQIVECGDSEIDKMAPTGGFKSLGHFAWCLVRRGRRNDGDAHANQMLKNWKELQVKAPSGMFEESDPDGGDLIPREFSNQVYERMVAMNQILPYLEGLPLTGNSLTIPALKEDSRQDGYRHGGVLGYWEGEADQYSRVRPQFRQINLKLHKLTVLTYVTEELLLDSAVALETYLGRLVPKEINFKINDALINGKGAGMPMGFLNAQSKLTVSARSGQGAGTFTYGNVLDMWSRAIAGQREGAVWLYGQDVEPAIYGMYQATGTAAGVAVFTPNEPVQFKLMGRPALVMEQCQVLGTEGDVILFCPEGYATIIKGGLQSFMSMHLRFDYDEFAYKWRFRMDGQPYDDVALTAFKGSNTYSSIVTLNSTRS